MRQKVSTGTDTWQWLWWAAFMAIRAVFTFSLFFFVCNAIDTVAMRVRRRELVREAQAKHKEPRLVA